MSNFVNTDNTKSSHHITHQNDNIKKMHEEQFKAQMAYLHLTSILANDFSNMISNLNVNDFQTNGDLNLSALSPEELKLIITNPTLLYKAYAELMKNFQQRTMALLIKLTMSYVERTIKNNAKTIKDNAKYNKEIAAHKTDDKSSSTSPYNSLKASK